MQVTVKRIRVAKLTRYTLGKKTWETIGAVVEAGILKNIALQKQEDGSSLKRNAPSTSKRKRKRGVTPLSLIDKMFRFVRKGQGSWKYKAEKDSVKIIPATSELRRLARFVQERGYLGWFGISKQTIGKIKGIMRERIKELIRQNASKQR